MYNNAELEKLMGRIVRKGRNSGQPYTETIAHALWNCLRQAECEAVLKELEAIRRRNDEFGQRVQACSITQKE